MEKTKYLSTIKSKPFLYYQSKTIARLFVLNQNRQLVIEKCLNNDILGIDSKTRIKEVSSKILKRLSFLDNYLLDKLINADTSTSKFILLYSIMRQDRLFFEFVFEVYQDALDKSKNYISQDDLFNFFTIKKEMNNRVSTWGDKTIIDLANAYRSVLKESGFGRKDKNKIIIRTPLIDPEVIKHIKQQGHSDFVNSLFGGKG